jgi:NAD dependent epimerase/dehydratase family enzyme
MKIVIPGGSGQVGTILARALGGEGHDVVVLSRSDGGERAWRTVRWDGRTPGAWAAEVDGADVVINLAGRNVNCRYTARRRREILDSRVESTRVVGEAIAAARRPPRVWLQASTATIYAHRFDAPNDDVDGIIGGGRAGGAPIRGSSASTWRRRGSGRRWRRRRRGRERC